MFRAGEEVRWGSGADQMPTRERGQGEWEKGGGQGGDRCFLP